MNRIDTSSMMKREGNFIYSLNLMNINLFYSLNLKVQIIDNSMPITG